MINSAFEPGRIPEICTPFVSAFEREAPLQVVDQMRQRSVEWKGDGLFLNYDWGSDTFGAIAMVKLQIYPSRGEVWIGALEVHSDYREQGFGTQIVEAVEGASQAQRLETIRLFSRLNATGFWLRLGFRFDTDPRYLRKAARAADPLCSHD